MSTSFRHEWQTLWRLALPLIAGGAVFTIVPFVNTAYAGRLGQDQLAAGGLVSAIFIFFMVLFWGIFGSVATFIARYEGEEKNSLVGQVFRTGCVLAVLLSIPVMGFFYFAGKLFVLLGQSEVVVQLASSYCRALSFAILPDFLLIVLYDLCLGLSKPRYVMFASFLMIPLNLSLNYLFTFGHFGFPNLGLAGLGVGTAVAYWLVLFGFIVLLLNLKKFKPYFRSNYWFVKQQAKELLGQGIPVGLQWMAETGFFAMVALLMGYLGPLALAAHQIAFQTYAFVFAIFYSCSQAVMIRTAEGVGAKNLSQVRYSYLGGHVFMLILAFFLILACSVFQKELFHFYLGEDEAMNGALLLLAHKLLYLAPLYFIVDCLGFTHFTVLRAFKDSRYTMTVALVVYWLLAIPLMWVGIRFWHWQSPVDLWWVMVAAGLCSFVGQGLRYRYQYARFKREATTVRSS